MPKIEAQSGGMHAEKGGMPKIELWSDAEKRIQMLRCGYKGVCDMWEEWGRRRLGSSSASTSREMASSTRSVLTRSVSTRSAERVAAAVGSLPPPPAVPLSYWLLPSPPLPSSSSSLLVLFSFSHSTPCAQQLRLALSICRNISTMSSAAFCRLHNSEDDSEEKTFSQSLIRIHYTEKLTL